MKTITEIVKPKRTGHFFDFRGPKRKPAGKSIIFLVFALSLSPLCSLAQRFWLTTYEFPYGAKTGITLTKNNGLFVGLTNGIIRSVDEGNHFERVLKSSAIFSIFSTHDGKVLAGGSGKIFITDSSGQTWDSIAIDAVYPVIQFAENSKGDLFAIASGFDSNKEDFAGAGVLFSNDRGRSWTQRNSGLGAYTSCEKIEIDKNDRLYAASADKYNSGHAGLFISDDNGLHWKHIDVTIDGKHVIENQLKVGNTFGLSVSPQDSLHFSFAGLAGLAGVEINCRKSINDVEKNNFWETDPVSNSNLWWEDTNLFDIYYAKNGDRYSSCEGTMNSGATYYQKNGSRRWTKVDYGLGLTMSGRRDIQFFAENPEGKIFMVQLLDERVYWTDASLLTSADPAPGLLNQLKLYPNPVISGEYLSIQGFENNRTCGINVFDGLGRRVISDLASGTIHRLKVSLKPGLYYLQVADRSTRETQQFVVK